MTELSIIQKITVWALPILFAITFHEVAHGFVAYLRGDYTAKFAGRLSLNPAKHIDLVGTIILPLLMLATSNFIFGWAKPVPVDPRNLRNPRVDMALVAIAGPLSNLLMAFAWGGIEKLGITLAHGGNSAVGIPLAYMGEAGIWINVIIGVLNLIPLPPLDGSKILSSFLSPRAAYHFNQLEPYGFIILILLMVFGILSLIMTPSVLFMINLVSYSVGL